MWKRYDSSKSDKFCKYELHMKIIWAITGSLCEMPNSLYEELKFFGEYWNNKYSEVCGLLLWF